MENFRHLVLSLVVCGAAACGGVDPTDVRNDGVQAESSAETPNAPSVTEAATEASTTPVGTDDRSALSGSCARPIEIRPAGARFGAGSSTVYRGSTEGMSNELHPYGRRIAQDAAEVVYAYRVPEGTQALEISTEGSAFDTVLYVRSRCEQHEEGEDLAFNDNAYGQGAQSTVYLTHATPGQTVYIVVDGNPAQGASGGRFQLTVRNLAFGQSGAPCNYNDDAPRCAPSLRCSEGATADGADLCLPTVPMGSGCDPRGFTSACVEGASCVFDSSSLGSRLQGPVCRPSR